MRLPWSGPSAADIVRTVMQAEIHRLTADLAIERDRYTALVRDMQALQRQGFTPPAPTVAPGPDPNRLHPDIELAIAEHMNPRGSAGRDTAELARQWIAAKVPVEDIVSRIHRGAGDE